MQNAMPRPVNITWRNQQPYSHQFDDVYFSTDNGLEETDYVFLQGNQLAARWQQGQFDQFTIIETGFGTGLNFLCAANLWLNTAPANAQLHFISIEKYPLSINEITQALSIWPQLQHLTPSFLHQYTAFNNQTCTIKLNENIHLLLLIGDVIDCLNRISSQADAWFLDGFSPAKNPEMWQPSVFSAMAKNSHSTSTFSTFTSAGIVRRGLIDAGFTVKKQAGYGKKREMLTGFLSQQFS
jgi:tRNA 5-methylaminomethyl-2-thiouridine biosynthesis bifunctional protein